MGEQRIRWWQHLTLSWVNSLIKRGLKREVLGLDACHLPTASHADEVYDSFHKRWVDAVAEAKGSKKDKLQSRTLLVRVLAGLYGREYAIGGAFKLLWGALVIAGAFYFVRSLLFFVQGDDPLYHEPWTGWVLGAGFFVAAVLWGAHSAAGISTALRLVALYHWGSTRHACRVSDL